MKKITVLGDGAFGTAIAQTLAHQGHRVTLWCHDAEIADHICQNRINDRYLPSISLHENIYATPDLQHALHNDLIFQAIPMIFLRSILVQCAPYTRPSHMWISLTKGIEDHTAYFATDLIQNILGAHQDAVAALSGPSYARELAENQPTGFIIAARNENLAQHIINLMHHKNIVLQKSSDISGVQLCAALKNIVALAIGILDGAGYHSNTQALLLIKCINEIKIMGQVYGIDENSIQTTLFGLAGIGDIALTCFGKQSRNYHFGVGIGQGKTKEEITQQLGQAPEGVNTLKVISVFTSEHGLKLPIYACIDAIINKNGKIKDLITLLLN